MAESIFFTPVSANVQNTLNARGAAYKATNRTSEDLNWLLKKTATANAIATSARGSATLLLARKGGLGDSGLYTKPTSTNLRATSNDVPHYRPDPHLNSVKVSSAGDFGSIRKVEIAFTVYSLDQLDKKQAFFDIGAALSVSYAWTNAGALGGLPGVFQGIIYNFSYTLNDSGGFDCTTFAMGNGTNVLGLSARAAVTDTRKAARQQEAAAAAAKQQAANAAKQKAEDAAARAAIIATSSPFNDIGAALLNLAFDIKQREIREAKLAAAKPPTVASINVGNLSGRIKDLVDAALKVKNDNKGPAGAGVDQQSGICLMYYDKDVIGPDLTGEVPIDPITNAPSSKWLSDNIYEKHAFISLSMLTSLVNDIIQVTAGTKFKGIICDKAHTIANMPKTVTPMGDSTYWRKEIAMVSADPSEIVFPGYATYSHRKTADKAGSATFNSDFNLDSFTNGDSPYDWATQFKLGFLGATLINVDFLTRIFDGLGTETTKGQQSADETFSAMYSKIFQSIYKNSGNRFQLSLVSDPKAPNQVLMVDVNYVNATPNIFEIKAVTDGGFCRSISLASKVPQESAAAAMVTATTTATSNNSGALKNIFDPDGTLVQPPIELLSVDDAIKIICEGEGFTTTNIEGLRSAMQHKKVNTKSDDAIVYPIEFSATMDGVEGFVFGNTVTCNYLPAAMIHAKIVHTILNVEHDISNSDWTTSITTVCRLLE